MTFNLDEFWTLKRRADRLRQKAAEAEGTRKEILRRLKEEFGCASLEEAKAMLAELQEKERKLGAKYTKLFKDFREKWSHVLATEDGGPADGKVEGGEGGGEGRKGRRR